jgi:exopolysaccharide biosynthesis polyprenyl glycosylphosphotransferase
MHVNRRLYENGVKLFDLFLMAISFAVSTLTQYHRAGSISLAEFFKMSATVGDFLLFVALVMTWHLLFNWFGLYVSRRLTASRWEEIWDITKATTVSALVVCLSGLMLHPLLASRAFLIMFWMAATVSLVLSRMGIRAGLAYARRHGRNTRNMLVIGTNARAVQMVQRIQRKPELGYRVLGFADEEWLGMEEFRKHGHSLVSNLDALPTYVRRNVVDEVVIALPIRSYHTFASEVASACEQQGIVVRFQSNIFDLKEARQRTEELDGDPLISHESTITDFWGLMVKRAIDIVVSLTAIVLLSPVLLLTAILVKLTSPGGVLFVQKRLGLNKRIFNIYKFRTMVADAEARLKDLEHQNEADGAVFKIKNDPRITRIGAFLRKTSIDEFPQLFNVLKGEMSLVGPRPLQVRDYELFEVHCQDWQRRRFSVRPGITCLWQIMGRSSTTFERWMELDLQYIRTWSVWLDLEILAKTVPAVLRGSGAA